MVSCENQVFGLRYAIKGLECNFELVESVFMIKNTAIQSYICKDKRV